MDHRVDPEKTSIPREFHTHHFSGQMTMKAGASRRQRSKTCSIFHIPHILIIFIHHIITWYPHTSLKQKTFHIQSKLSETANTCNEYLHSLPFSHALMAAQPAISTDSLNISESNNLGTRDWNHQSAWCQCPCANISAIVATSIAWTMEVSAWPVPVVSAK